MKKLKTLGLLFVLILMYNQLAFSQLNPQGNDSNFKNNLKESSILNESLDSVKYLDLNYVHARITSYKTLFFNGYDNHYYVPAETGCSSIFSSSLWIGGFDETHNLHLSAERFNQIGHDYFPGPLNPFNNTNSWEYTEELYNKFNRVWKVSQEDINEFITKFNEGEDVSEFKDIIEWPATNIEGYEGNLAPFVDVNGDGIYNPLEHGDYPLIKGGQMLWWVNNDVSNIENLAPEVESEPLGIQIEYSFYAYKYDNPPDEITDLINYQTFLNIKITNKSNHVYDSVLVGLFVDGDLGYAFDDFIGCDVERNTFYFYNGEEIDGSQYPNVPNYYGENPPIQTVTLLNTPLVNSNYPNNSNNNSQTGMSRFIYFNNCANNNLGIDDPHHAYEHYNYLNGYWKYGHALCYGGNGHSSGGGDINIPCKYMFPGDTDTLFTGTNGIPVPSWSEEECENTPDDRRGLASMGPISFQPGETIEIDVLFGFIPQDENNDQAKTMQTGKFDYGPKLDTLINWFHQDRIPSTITSIEEINLNDEKIKDIKIFPNPANRILNISGKNNFKEIKIYDIKGVCVKHISKNTNQVQIDIKNLNSGVYFIEISGENYSFKEKFIKQ
ncbi:MAG: T9SS type A sorting domain-containing protein [Bacteroidales bacterium]|nr:T9SS type A sorting domain-containing protein [Bacteroidales bacterium]